jgi:hypothetical protein
VRRICRAARRQRLGGRRHVREHRARAGRAARRSATAAAGAARAGAVAAVQGVRRRGAPFPRGVGVHRARGTSAGHAPRRARRPAGHHRAAVRPGGPRRADRGARVLPQSRLARYGRGPAARAVAGAAAPRGRRCGHGSAARRSGGRCCSSPRWRWSGWP